MNNHDSNQLALFNIQNFEYNILISPGKRVSQQVYYLKDRISRIIKVAESDLKSVPHISLLKLKYKDDDNLIISLVKHALLYTRKFQVELNGVNYFDHKRSQTLYLNISNPEPIIALHQNITSAFGFKEKQLTPHVTIVRSGPSADLTKIRKAIPSYHEKFWCTRITVLKKAFNSSDRYTKIYEVYLN